MLKNYLKIAFRSLGRAKTHSTINILGLGLGIASCVLIALFVRDEWTFDTFHSQAKRIYRVWGKENYGENQEFFYTSTPFPMGPTLKQNFEEIAAEVRVNPINSQVKVGENHYNETVTIVGQDFLTVFDFSILSGQREGALRGLHNVVITRRTADKYFGPAEAVGKVISIQLGENFEDFGVSAVVGNPPTNSSIQFDILIPDLNFPKLYSERALTTAWFNIAPETYVLLRERADAGQLVSKFPTLFKRLLGPDFKGKYQVGLQPLTTIHLDTDFPVGLAPVNNPKYSYILAAIASLILFVACINFVTLSVGRSFKRAKEVGIRKAIGADRVQLIVQFIGEAVLVTIISLIVGIFLARLALPLFNDLAGRNLALRPEGFTLLISVVLVSVIGLLAGSYPAFVLSAFRPISILKGKVQTGSGKQGLRKMLVGIQLVLSIFLISSTLVMRQQLQFLRDKNLGFNKEQLAVIQLNVPRSVGRLPQRVKAGFDKVIQFKNELTRIPGVKAVCGSSHDFANGGWVNIGYTDDHGTYRTFETNIVDEDYIPTLNIQLAMGRNFSKENPSDGRRSIIINEAFAKELGWSDPLGKRLPGKDFQENEVIGVVKDFNFSSLYNKVTPLLLAMDLNIPLSGSENVNTDNSPIPKLLIRLRPDHIQASMDQVRVVWDKITGNEEFAFTFVDQALANQYRNDQNLGKIVSVATVLAILIGSFGLYGLASLAMQSRTKEISIRKVMGATEQSLLVLLSRDYLGLILVCMVLSVPVTYYLMSEWLQSFEYRVGIGADSFLLAGAISLVIALLTISYHALKTASSQPAETLKYE
jgi:putative ABC transport system permease protein